MNVTHEIQSSNAFIVNRILWKLKLSNKEINFQNALELANEQTDIYPPRLAGMVVHYVMYLGRK